VSAESGPWYERWAWAVVAALGSLLTLFGLFVVSSPVDANDFETETGVAWEAFQTAEPAVADYLAREARLLAVITIGFGLLVAVLAATLLRQGDRTTAFVLSIFPATLLLAAIVFFASDAATLGAFYVGATVVATIAMALSMRTVRT
jgi:hypothetical protein